jgi:hypothetical protein
MQLLYVVELRVDSARRGGSPDPGPSFDRVLDHLVSWQTHEHPGELTRDMLHVSSSLTLTGETGAQRRLEWTNSVVGTVRCLQFAVRTGLRATGDADFVCRVTLFRDDDRTVLRLELGREVASGVLAPAGMRFLRRPFLLVLLADDPELSLWTGLDQVTGKYARVGSEEVEEFWDELNRPARQLPILMVHSKGKSNDSVAWRCAGELSGLASVRVLDDAARQILASRLASIDASVPDSGARLVWPDLTLRHPSFEAGPGPSLHSRLLRLLSSVSVPARGTNGLIRRLAVVQLAARTARFDRQLQEAKAGGLEAEVEAQAVRIAELQASELQWVGEIEALEQERDELKTQAAMTAYWKEQAELAWAASGEESEDWGDAPELDPQDMGEFADFLEKVSDGAIVFTPRALRSWRKDKYPHVDTMRDALMQLAKAAVEYRRMGSQFAMHSDEWFKTVWGLTMAATDGYMTTHRMHKFDFEGENHSRLPHLKLDDFVSPNEVGRVYFAMDSRNQRFIVDHVGLKLYGL